MSKQAMKASSPIDDLPRPGEALLDSILDELDVRQPAKRTKAKRQLAAHAEAFALGRFFQQHYPTVHQDVQTMGKIRDGIDGLTERFDRLGPVVKLGLEEAFRQKSEPDRTWDGLLKDMAQLREIADRFGSAKFVRKQRDEILKQAVGGLMLLLEMLTGNRAFGRRANSVTGSPPELVNAEARAIASLLRVTEPRLPDTTIVNVIRAIRSKAGDGPLAEFEHQLLLGAPAYPIRRKIPEAD